MTVEKLQRVLWRLRSMRPGKRDFLLKELELSIMYEIGTDERTVKKAKKALRKFGWIQTGKSSKWVYTTEKDITQV